MHRVTLIVALALASIMLAGCVGGELDYSQIDRAAGQVESVAGSVSAGASAVAPLLPPPLNGIVGILAVIAGGVGTIAGSARAWANQQSAVRIAKAIEVAKVDGVVNFNDANTKSLLSAEMGVAGKRIVDRAQGNAA